MGNTKNRYGLIIIKLGGSIVTFKDSSTPKVRISNIRRLAKEILAIQKKGFKMILVHGAGSFGHPLAKKYNLTKGFQNKNSCYGFLETISSVKQLNSIIINALQKTGIQALSLHPHTFITQTGGEMDEFDISIIKKLLDQNIVPVLHGDPVIDQSLGSSILSGDTIIPYLAKKLEAEKVVFLSDVDGIFSEDPRKNPKAKLIPKITNKNFQKVLKNLKASGRDDVTGEMAGKLIAIKKNLAGIKVVIGSGILKNTLQKIIKGEKLGTLLYF